MSRISPLARACLLGGMLFTSPAFASFKDCPPVSGTLSLAEAVSIAWCAHPARMRTEAELQAAEAAVAGARAAKLPTLAASAGLSDATRENASTSDGQLVLSWTAFDGGVRAARETAARHGVRAAHSANEDARSARALAVIRAWLGLHEAVATERLFIDQAAEAEHLHARANAQKALGRVSRLDVHQAEAHWRQAHLKALQARTQVTAARHRLEAELGGAPIGDLASLGTAEEGLATLWTMEFREPPALVALAAQHEAAGEQVHAARAEYRPSVNVQAAAHWQAAGGARADQRTVGVVLNVPLYTGGAREARVREALARQALARGALDEYALNHSAALQGAQESLALSEESVRTAEAAIAAAALAVEAALARYDAGVGSLFETLEARRQHSQASLDLIGARIARLDTFFTVERLTGRLARRFHGAGGRDRLTSMKGIE